jgi:hypothetical protein
MRARVAGAATVGVFVAAAALVSPLGGTAVAGHTNAVVRAELTGGQEVPKKGDRNGRGQIHVFGVDGDPKTLCYVLTVAKIKLGATGVAAHIHQGPKGKNGPVVVNLAGPGDGDAADCLTEGEKVGPAKDIDAFPGEITVQDILGNPERFYVNVHNEQHPNGALRGQLAKNG